MCHLMPGCDILMSAYVFARQDIATLFSKHCIIQEMSGYDNIKMYLIAYLAVLGSEGYSIYDMAYYPCPVYDNIMSVYVFLITF